MKDTTALNYLGTCLAADGGATNEKAPFGWVKGKAITTGVNRYRLVILPEAMKKAYAAFMTNPVLALGHRIDADPEAGLPIGSVLGLEWDAEGNTLFEARFANTPEAQKVRGLYNSGDMRAFSIQFRTLGRRDPNTEELRRWPGVEQIITDLDLIEISCCVVGVDAGALSTTSQALDKLARPKAVAATPESPMKFALPDEAKKHLNSLKAQYNDATQAMGGCAEALEELGADGDGKDHAFSVKKLGAHMALLGEAYKAMKGTHQSFSKAAVQAEDPAEGNEPDPEDPAEGGEDEPSDEEKQSILKNLDEELKGISFETKA